MRRKVIKIVDTYYQNAKLPVGTKIKFAEEKQVYTVRASNIMFAVCNKPMNVHKTMLYTVINWFENIRGIENLIFGMGAETPKQCREMLKRLTNGISEVSYRNRIPLVIERLEQSQPEVEDKLKGKEDV